MCEEKVVTTAETLYQLQQADDDVRAKEKRLAKVEGQLGESEELHAARASLEEAEAELYELEKKQRQQELELKTVASKIESEESRLYGGRVTNPKELAGLQKEVRYLKERRVDIEDSLLETMMSREETASRVKERKATLEKIESGWESAQSTLATERDQLESDLAELQRRRTHLIDEIPPDVLSTYDYLRRLKGSAVAQFENGMCMGCRVGLSTVDRHRAKSGDLTTCSNCGRLLVVM
ncbi:MAG: hypothetical protein MAG451_01826 [Anaerolineales bacterium]|nr:hypothetical protein [Anaerolineales bacterium]